VRGKEGIHRGQRSWGRQNPNTKKERCPRRRRERIYEKKKGWEVFAKPRRDREKNVRGANNRRAMKTSGGEGAPALRGHQKTTKKPKKKQKKQGGGRSELSKKGGARGVGGRLARKKNNGQPKKH